MTYLKKKVFISILKKYIRQSILRYSMGLSRWGRHSTYRRPAAGMDDGLDCLSCPVAHSLAERLTREGKPVVFILADQAFPAMLPAREGDCAVIVCVEDGRYPGRNRGGIFGEDGGLSGSAWEAVTRKLDSNRQSWAHRSLKSFFALERTLILRAMALLETKSEAL